MKKRLSAWLLVCAMLLGQICVPALADGVPFAAEAGGTALSVVKSDTDYSYTEIVYDVSWTPVGSETRSVPLYTVTVPAGTAAVTLDFAPEARLAYAYTAAGDYASACGDYGDGTVGQTTASVTDFTQFIRVQTPYDASWSSDFLYAVGFEVAAPTIPFAAEAGGTALSVVKSDTDYSYTEVIYDASWTPVGSETRSVPLYTVTVPAGTTAVTLDFAPEARLAYAYTAAGDYASACGDYGDGTVGQAAASVTDFTQFIRVQTPYDASWNSEFLYAVGFAGEGATGGSGTVGGVDLELLIAMLGADWGEKTGDDWEIISAGMYETLCGVTPGAEAVQARISAVTGRLDKTSISDAEAAKAILALRASGLDPARVTTALGNGIDLTQTLAAAPTTSIYNAPYVLLACQQGDYSAAKEAAVRQFLLDNQNEDGSWAASPDTTGIVLTALAAYAGDPAVDAAVTRGKDYLLGCISPAGTCSSIWSSDNADTTAMALIGLAAAGVDPESARAAGGKSIAEGLLSFALSDHSGFGYTDASARNEIATRDGFWGALCIKFGAGTRLFDFTGNAAAPAAAPLVAGGTPVGGGTTEDPTPSEEKTMTVTFSVIGSNGTWMSARRITAEENATAIEVLRQALDANAAFSYSESGGYLRSVTYNGVTVGEFTEGPNSGWKYTVNGEAPMVGMGSYILAPGDRLTVYYVQDYTADPTPNQGGATFTDPQSGATDPTATDPAEPAQETPAASFTDTQGHPAQTAIEFCRERGIMSGTGAGTFSPDAAMSRAMLITVLYNLEGKPAAAGADFPDVSEGAWYAAPIGWAVQAGLCSGYGSGLFGPENDVSAEQLAIILSRYVQYKRQNVAFTLPGNAFDGVTRGQIAQMLMEYLQKTA